MKFGFGKRIAGFVLAAAVAAGTFLSTPATAKAAAPLAKGELMYPNIRAR